MTATTEALVLEEPRRLVRRELPLPEVGDDDALLRVEACGLCGTDHELFTGELFPGYAFVPGHETIGVIERIGPAAAARWEVREGDRVAVEVYQSCRECGACRAGDTRRCERHGLANTDASALARMFEMRAGEADDADTASLEEAARRMLEITRAAEHHRPEIAAGYFTTGLETASALSGAVIGVAAADADLWGWLPTADEAGRRAYIDEVARLVSPVQFALYSPNQAIEVDGTTIPAGAHIVVLITAANLDPTVFADPGSIRLERSERHLAFGLGAHACIGGGVAMAQAWALLDAALERWPSVSVSRASWRPPAMIGGLDEAWLRPGA